jgi:hypothetical protein
MGKKAEGNGARRRPRRAFTPEFKAEVIALVRQGERHSVAEESRYRYRFAIWYRRWTAAGAMSWSVSWQDPRPSARAILCAARTPL